MSRTQWTDELALDECKKIAKGLGHFPSNSDLTSLGRGDLSSQIVKRLGGFVEASRMVGIDRLHSDSDTGWDGELMAQDMLEVAGYHVGLAGNIKAPFDLLVDGVVRIDVKAASYAEYGPCRGWFYRIGKYCQCDLVMLVRLDRRDSLLIPWWSVPTSNITITENGKYQKYYEAFHLIDERIKALSKMRDNE